MNLVAGANELPRHASTSSIEIREWLMVPRALAEDLTSVDPRSPEYLGRLARYVRGQSTELEGLYLSPVSASAAHYTTSVVRDIAERYAIDGVLFDYIRHPRDDFDGLDTLRAFRGSVSVE